MPKTKYVILGPDSPRGESQYWNESLNEWTEDFDNATVYDREVHLTPLPPEGVGIIEYNIGENNALNFTGFYQPLP